MGISIYTFIMAGLWFSIFIIIGNFLQQKIGYIPHYSTGFLLFFLALSVIRLFIPIEIFAFTATIQITEIVPHITRFLNEKFDFLGLSINLWSMLFFIWVIGSIVYFIVLVSRARHDAKIIKELCDNSIESKEVDSLMTQIKERSTYSGSCFVAISPDVPNPMVVGISKQTILLPKQILELSHENLMFVLAHEWYHIVNRDVWISLFTQFICCIFWWNPIVYLLNNNIKQLIEIRCDLSVTRQMSIIEKNNYLKTMLKTIDKCNQNNFNSSKKITFATFPYQGTMQGRCLKQRFFSVGQYNNLNKNKIKMFIIAFVMILTFIISYSFIIQPVGYPTVEDLGDSNIVNRDVMYIIALKDGEYQLHYNEDLIVEISEDTVNVLLSDNVPIVYK